MYSCITYGILRSNGNTCHNQTMHPAYITDRHHKHRDLVWCFVFAEHQSNFLTMLQCNFAVCKTICILASQWLYKFDKITKITWLLELKTWKVSHISFAARISPDNFAVLVREMKRASDLR